MPPLSESSDSSDSPTSSIEISPLLLSGKASTVKNESLFSEPKAFEAATPSPISTAFTAPMDMMPSARRASSLSKTGSPIPGTSPRTLHSTTPPAESPSSLNFRIRASASARPSEVEREIPASSITLASTST